MNFDEVLQMPMKRFWFLVRQLPRLEAEDDLRMIRTGASVGSADSYKAATEHFETLMGDIYVFDRTEPVIMRIDPETGMDPEFDRAGLHALKNKF